MIDVPVAGLVATTSGDAIDLQDSTGRIRATYSGLHVSDASGRAVAASMQAVSHGDAIDIEVLDGAARYPLTVHPTWSQVSEVTSSDGSNYDFFGPVGGGVGNDSHCGCL